MRLHPISNKDRLSDLSEALEYGNHKSAVSGAPNLLKILAKEVAKGWQLPLPINGLIDIPGSVSGPLGLAYQDAIDESDNVVQKERVTHDQTWAFSSEQSVNQRVIKEDRSNCVYGFALRRFIHVIVALREINPKASILLSKFDFKSAYRRMHLHASSALQSIVTTTSLEPDPIALASLRVTFGGSPSSYLFAELSDLVADLASALVRCTSWDSLTLRPPHSELIKAPLYQDDDIPLAPARAMLVDPKVDKFGTTEVFIDDVFSAFPALSHEHIDKCSQAVLLALAVVARPHSGVEHLPRDDMLSIEKAIAEGTPAEVLIILGWTIDTRRMLISLPKHKHQAWTKDIRTILDKAPGQNRIPLKDLETLLGRLQHTAAILPEGPHFLNRLRTAVERARKHRATRLSAETRLDLEFWILLLDRAAAGIDLNLLVTRAPDRMLRTDACEFGLGGYSLTTGRAWRWEIPVELRGLKSINYLEFLACIGGLLLSLWEDDPAAGDCYLSLGDNTSSLGWLRRSNFAADVEQASHSALARFYILEMAKRHLCQFSQWFAGRDNGPADLCSREHKSSNTHLTRAIKLLYPSQVSSDFQISPLPPEIISILDYWVRHSPDTTESPPPLTPSKTAAGPGGPNSSTKVNSTETNSSTHSQGTTSTTSLAPSPTESATANGPPVQKEMLSWLQQHASPPSMVYARPSSQAVDPTRPWMQMANLRSFYNVSTKATETTIPQQSRRKRSHSASSLR